MYRLFTSRAGKGNRQNPRRRWLPLVVLVLVLTAAGFKVVSSTGFLAKAIAIKDGHAATTLLVELQSDFPSLDRLDSVQWAVAVHQAAGAFVQRNVIVGHVITFVLAILTCGLGYVALRSFRDMAAARGITKSNDSFSGKAGGEAPVAFVLGEPIVRKDDHNSGFRIEPREYELGIDASEDQLTLARAAALEPEWKL
jgi:hypothetical protein